MPNTASSLSFGLSFCVTSLSPPSDLGPYRCGVPCAVPHSRGLGLLAVASAYRARACSARLAARVCSRQPDGPPHSARRHRHRLTLHLLQRSAPPLHYASPPCAVLCCAALPLCPKLARSPPTDTLPARSSCPTISSVWRAGTRGPLTFTCSRTVTLLPFLLLHSAVIHHAWTRRPPQLALDPSCNIRSTLVGLFLADSKN